MLLFIMNCFVYNGKWQKSRPKIFVQCFLFLKPLLQNLRQLGGQVKAEKLRVNKREKNGQEDRLRLCNFWIGMFSVN
jgi:hypothetical protein